MKASVSYEESPGPPASTLAMMFMLGIYRRYIDQVSAVNVSRRAR